MSRAAMLLHMQVCCRLASGRLPLSLESPHLPLSIIIFLSWGR
jgi:hypothetical protein